MEEVSFKCYGVLLIDPIAFRIGKQGAGGDGAPLGLGARDSGLDRVNLYS